MKVDASSRQTLARRTAPSSPRQQESLDGASTGDLLLATRETGYDQSVFDTAVEGPTATHAVHDDFYNDAPVQRSAFYERTKRLVDIVGSLFLITLFFPVLFAIWFFLHYLAGGKAIFRQKRVGANGRLFEMYKFRSMVPDAHKVQHLVDNEQDGPIFKNKRDPRITFLGRILRATSLDEMPQLFNVLRGDMTLVGPRPPVPAEVAVYEPWQRYRLAVTPGLTCLWQVSGRSDVGFEDWMRMDLWYVNNRSLLVDLTLLILTPWTVIRCRGAY